MAYMDVVDPMTGKHEQIRPLEEIGAEMDALDVQIKELQSKRGALKGEHDRTAELIGLTVRIF